MLLITLHIHTRTKITFSYQTRLSINFQFDCYRWLKIGLLLFPPSLLLICLALILTATSNCSNTSSCSDNNQKPCPSTSTLFAFDFQGGVPFIYASVVALIGATLFLIYEELDAWFRGVLITKPTFTFIKGKLKDFHLRLGGMISRAEGKFLSLQVRLSVLE